MILKFLFSFSIGPSRLSKYTAQLFGVQTHNEYPVYSIQKEETSHTNTYRGHNTNISDISIINFSNSHPFDVYTLISRAILYQVCSNSLCFPPKRNFYP